MRPTLPPATSALVLAVVLLGLARADQPAPIPALAGHCGGVTALAFSSNGERFASGAGNGIVRVWDARTGIQLGKLEEFKGTSITGLSYSPDGRILAASGKGKAGYWLDHYIRTGKTEPPPKKKVVFIEPGADKGDNASFKWTAFPSTDSDATYVDAAVTGDGKFVYFVRRHMGLSYPGRVLRYDIARDSTEERPGPRYLDPRAVACIDDPDSGVAAVYTGLDKGEAAIQLLGLGDTRTISRGVPAISPSGTPRIAFSFDSSWLVAWSGSLAAWPVPGSHVIGGDPAVIPGVYAAATWNGGIVATVPPPNEFRRSEVTFWKLGAQTREYGMLGHRWLRQVVEAKKLATHPTTLKDVGCIAFSPDGRFLAIGGETDGVIQLWDMSFLNAR